MIIRNKVNAEKASIRSKSFILKDVRQWSLTHHDDFNSIEKLQGWSLNKTSKCGNSTNSFLGGHCALSYDEVTKEFENLPKHSILRLNSVLHMLDNWEGEKAYVKVDDKVIWTRQGKNTPNGLNHCGGEYSDPAFSLYFFFY